MNITLLCLKYIINHIFNQKTLRTKNNKAFKQKTKCQATFQTQNYQTQLIPTKRIFQFRIWVILRAQIGKRKQIFIKLLSEPKNVSEIAAFKTRSVHSFVQIE